MLTNTKRNIDADLIFLLNNNSISDNQKSYIPIIDGRIIILIKNLDIIIYDIEYDYILKKIDTSKININNIKIIDKFITINYNEGSRYIYDTYRIMNLSDLIIGEQCRSLLCQNKVVIPCGHAKFCDDCFIKIEETGKCFNCNDDQKYKVLNIKK